MVCRDHRCSHHVETNADGWADDVRLSDIEPRFVCTRRGRRGAEARSKFSQAIRWRSYTKKADRKGLAARALAQWTRP
ncbi:MULTISPECIES: hypothetical protein [unclassified Bradyrhizobium]|uniref:hypothetical protein n=1 Tax=unclassified Bradyrhizobium TaxID=2631580 RepID=UPI001BA826AD|nr:MULTISPECIES: hypothetical protein [unclassified Bradyrhizobium]MBR1228714.1 hypothetical protein [Bradyrhizobium sp. AUGA SZCCT0176]MBR1230634.1 hypothetical protein [Bradyrhizobium sp. AUGA SZCCT0182]MBR1284502.1 hypothetical protein [Bradyrhizobium sp. AUGA SZCCT0177]MBR1299641.1 hypothetical protein [Bradyrhizobium sp. AUGA SZCCT0042]